MTSLSALREKEGMGSITMLRTVYWFVVGGLIGFGVIGVLGIGAPFLLLGVILLVIGAWRLGVRDLWAALVGGGLVPFLILLYDLQNEDIQPVTTAQAYHTMALVFGAIAALGVLWGLIAMALTRRVPSRAG